MPRYLDIYETAKLIRRSPQSIRRYVREGRIPAVRIGNRLYFTEEAVSGFVVDVVPEKQEARR